MIKTNSFDSYPYPAGTNRLNAQVGLLTHPRLSRLPSFSPVAKNATNHNSSCKSRDTQQQVLFRIHTGFPFHSSASNVASELLVHCKCK